MSPAPVVPCPAGRFRVRILEPIALTASGPEATEIRLATCPSCRQSAPVGLNGRLGAHTVRRYVPPSTKENTP